MCLVITKMGKVEWCFQANPMDIIMRPSYMVVWDNYIWKNKGGEDDAGAWDYGRETN